MPLEKPILIANRPVHEIKIGLRSLAPDLCWPGTKLPDRQRDRMASPIRIRSVKHPDMIVLGARGGRPRRATQISIALSVGHRSGRGIDAAFRLRQFS